MQDYGTVFEIATQPSNWLVMGIGVIPLLIGGIALWGRHRFQWRRPGPLFPIVFLGCGVLCFVQVASQFHQSAALSSALRTGDYAVVEGVVTDFHPMPYQGHDEECFSVRQQRFCYSEYTLGPGFHNAASHGGPIRPGLPVRVAYVGQTILRLEIPKDQLRTPAESMAAAERSRQEASTQQENDPVQQGLQTAAYLTAVGVMLFWNFQWRTTMGFWIPPPYRRTTEYAFRMFFAILLVGSIARLIEQLADHPIRRQNAVITIAATATMYIFFGSFCVLMNRGIHRRHHRRA